MVVVIYMYTPSYQHALGPTVQAATLLCTNYLGEFSYSALCKALNYITFHRNGK